MTYQEWISEERKCKKYVSRESVWRACLRHGRVGVCPVCKSDSKKEDNKNLCERLDVVVDHLRGMDLRAMAATVEEAIEELKK